MAFRPTPTGIAAGMTSFGALALLGAWLAAVMLGMLDAAPAALSDPPVDREQIERGAYLAVLADCSACHTPADRPAFSGGLAIATPIGTVYATNITPDLATGIGRYRLYDFERAVRRGILPDGTPLYPAMPFPSYARLSDSDVRALYAYFMNGVAPVKHPNEATGIPWPLSMRWPLTYWRMLFAPAVSQSGDTRDDPQYLRGAYLVEGLGHCGSCHTPRGFALQEKALTAADGPGYLAGGLVGHYVAGDLRGDPLTGLGRFTEEDILRLLQTGRTDNTAAFGGMAEVVSHSTQFMREEDLRAVAHYLKALPGSRHEAGFAYDPAETSQLAAGNVSAPGALDYLNNCAACHRSSGKGYTQTFPALAGNPVVNNDDPSSLISIVLNGGSVPSTGKAPAAFAMPPFRTRLDDQETAAIVTFIRSSWGNKGTAVTSPEVARLRQATAEDQSPTARLGRTIVQ